MGVDFLRHSGWVNPSVLNKTVCLIGIGAVGSNIALLSAKMGFTKFKIWDPDIVENHNLPNQAYEPEHVGKLKTVAITEVLKRFNPEIKVTIYSDYFTTEKYKKELEGILVIAVDTMSARKDLASAMSLNWRLYRIFETRLGFNHGEVNIINPLDSSSIERWAAALKSDEEIEPGPCNLRMCGTLVYVTTGYTVQMMCGLCAAMFNEVDWKPASKQLFLLEENLFQVYSK